MILLDDHLVRDLVAGELPAGVGLDEDLATTNLWMFRLAGALARRGSSGSLAGPVAALGTDELARFRRELAQQLELLTVVPMRELVWSMADLQERHRALGHHLSAAMAEALAAAHALGATIAVAEADVGPGLRDAARADGLEFRVVTRPR